MDLELAEDRLFFQQNTRRFLERESPVERVRELHRTEHGVDPAWWQRAAELGWTSLLAAEDDGGGSLSGNPVQDAVIVAEELGRMVGPGPFLPTNVVISALSAGGSAGLKEEHLPGLLEGSTTAAWALAEQGGWAPGDVRTEARVEGDEVVLTGEKAYVEAGAAADVVLVVARTGDGLTQVLVPRDHPGVTVVPGHSLDLVRRFARLRFDEVRLPGTAVVGEPGGADGGVERQLQLALTLQSAESVGLMDRVFEFTFAYMGDRYAFGRPISSYQALKHRVADMLLHLESAKATTDAAARALDERDPEVARLVRIAAAYVGDTAVTFIQECVQLLGGIGVTWEHDIHLYLRRATLNRAVLGAPEQHREQIVVRLGV
ncbi:acyl-CoA dehydrogenase family protein [Pseudonocardia lacus]|uniref:acyl-CoA dehydrogenase family protein n=1 Tax=Pseudonocardia lacus TaxID=2835865 RepID=UPI001BDC27F6|nr:acyl-CoA dehydrogenase family protein [Pseudonocardia lacus]